MLIECFTTLGGAISLFNGWDRADDIRNCRLRRGPFPRRGGTLNVPANITDEVARKNCHAPGCENFIALFSLLNRPGTITVLEAYVAPEPVRRMRVIL